jgi:hypothetical protein
MISTLHAAGKVVMAFGIVYFSLASLLLPVVTLPAVSVIPSDKVWLKHHHHLPCLSVGCKQGRSSSSSSIPLPYRLEQHGGCCQLLSRLAPWWAWARVSLCQQ